MSLQVEHVRYICPISVETETVYLEKKIFNMRFREEDECKFTHRASHNLSPEDEHETCLRNTVVKFYFFQRTMGKVQKINGPEGSRGTVE